MDVEQPVDFNDHLYCLTGDPCNAGSDKNKVITALAQETTNLSKESHKLKKEIESFTGELENLRLRANKRKPFSVNSIKTDTKMRFFYWIADNRCFQCYLQFTQATCSSSNILER